MYLNPLKTLFLKLNPYPLFTLSVYLIKNEQVLVNNHVKPLGHPVPSRNLIFIKLMVVFRNNLIIKTFR